MGLTSIGNSGGNGKKTIALPLTLTGVEVVHLVDSLNEWTVALENGEGLTAHQRWMPLVRSALLQLASAYVELVGTGINGLGDGKLIDVYITEDMAWLLRSKVRTGDIAIDGKTQIGHVLLIKLYLLLLQFNSGWEDYKPTPSDDLDSKVVRLQEWKKENGHAEPEPPTISPDTDYTEY